jgi:hypothetical protein
MSAVPATVIMGAAAWMTPVAAATAITAAAATAITAAAATAIAAAAATAMAADGGTDFQSARRVLAARLGEYRRPGTPGLRIFEQYAGRNRVFCSLFASGGGRLQEGIGDFIGPAKQPRTCMD